MLKIVDANNYLRIQLERDPTGLPLRTITSEITFSKDVWIFVWDGKGGNERRRALFPEYKMKRLPASEPIWNAMNMAREVLGHTKALQITVPGYEGDDVIAALVALHGQKMETQILSNDRDLTALGVSMPMVNKVAAPPELIRLYKATVGDPSDNIPGIKGFGQKAWETCDKGELLRWYTRPFDLWNDILVVSECFSISKGCASWLIDNQELARTMWTIVGFMPPPQELINKNTKVGKPNAAEIEAFFKRYML